MATCGEYELERAIGWGRRSTFFAARTVGAKGPAAIVIRRARIVERTHRHAFLCAAAEQQAAVGAGCRRLAPILSFDCDETGFAFYATARYETSLAEFLEAGCRVDASLLREIVTGVLAALAELHDKSRRAHGNLTPGNILLDPQGRVFLTDLAPSGKDATTADDLFALGTLIYQLVRGTARVGFLNPPLGYSPEWTESLGGDAEIWREYTNRRLTKSRSTGPDAIKTAIDELKSLAAIKIETTPPPVKGDGGKPERDDIGPPPKKKSPLLKVVVIILLLAGGGGGYVFWKTREDAEKARIKKKADDDAIIAIQKAQPQAIKDLREELKNPLPDPIPEDKTLASLMGRIRTSLDGTGNKSDVKRLLGNWELPEKLKSQAAAWRNAPREWTRLAGELDAAAEIELDGDASIIKQLQGAIAARFAADELDREWVNVTRVLGDLKDANNPLIPDFTPWAMNEILTAKNLADAPGRAQGAVKPLREILTFQRDTGPLVLWERLEKEVPDVRRKPAIMQGWPERWIQDAKRFVGPTRQQRDAWQKILKNAGDRIPKLAIKDQPAWQEKLLVARSAADDALERDVPAVDRLMAEFDGLQLPMEVAHKRYVAFVTQWKTDVVKAVTPADVKNVFARFQSETAALLPAYQAQIGSKDFVKQMTEALKTPDKLTVTLPGWETIGASGTAAVCKYSKGNESFTMPFIALAKTGYAMAAFETPLILARLSGVNPAPPKDAGPQTRGTAGFIPTADWLWTAPKNLRAQGIPVFGPNVNPGDTGKDNVPATWLTFDEAKAVAASLGGQLPTSEQWSSAYAKAGKEQRLRSTAWSNQIPLLDAWFKRTGQRQNASGPDNGSFSKLTGLLPPDKILGKDKTYVLDQSPVPGAAPDNDLWLRSVEQKGGWQESSGFTHLIGNAAEWVDVGNATGAVMGGSVVSPQGLPTNTPIPIPTKDTPFFDVTFRMVVKTGAGGEGAGLIAFKKVAEGIPVPTGPAPQ